MAYFTKRFGSKRLQDSNKRGIQALNAKIISRNGHFNWLPRSSDLTPTSVTCEVKSIIYWRKLLLQLEMWNRNYVKMSMKDFNKIVNSGGIATGG